MSLIEGFHHVSMKCNKEEYDKVVDFYHNILELPIARTWENGIMFDLNPGYIEVFTNGESLEKGTIRHYALKTNDVDLIIEKTRKAGYEIKMEPTDIVIESNPAYPARVGFVIGPLGEEIEFFKEK